MTVSELKRVLELVPDEYEVHIEGQEVGELELCERSKSSLKCHIELNDHSQLPAFLGTAFTERKTDGVLNLLVLQTNEG